MRKRRGYKFTNKKHPTRAVTSTALGVIALVAYIVSIVLATKGRGVVGNQIGLSTLLGFLYACIGLYLAIASRFEKEKYYLFCYVGMAVNFLVIVMAIVTLYLGIRA